MVRDFSQEVYIMRFVLVSAVVASRITGVILTFFVKGYRIDMSRSSFLR